MINGINDFEREVLEYKPSLGFIPKILSTVTKAGEYVMPPALEQLTKVLPSDTLQEINNLLNDISDVMDDIDDKLDGAVVNGVSFDEYKKEKASARPDFEKICNFENYHEQDVNGTTEGEVYPILKDLEDEMKDYRDFLNNQFFNGTANYEHLDVVKNDEIEEIEEAIEKDMNNDLDDKTYEALEVKSLLSNYAHSRIQNSSNFVKKIKDVLCSDINTYYNDNIEEVVGTFGNMPTTVLDSLNGINLIQFNKKVKETVQDKRRFLRLNTKEMKDDINKIVDKITKLKTNNCNKLLDYVSNMDTNYDESPNTIIVRQILDNIEFIHSEYNRILKELYKYNHLDSVVKNDQVETLFSKKRDRENYKLIHKISDQKKNNNFRLSNFVGD